MCGINGYLYKAGQAEERLKQTLGAMNAAIYHRGPDDQGIFSTEETTYSLAMGMQRLSIIDLSTGHQPMHSDDGQITIVFNGEIYNYKQLKEKLLKDNISFKTTSDTEVILRLYEQHGPEAFKELDGMYGFSIYDRNKQKIIIARDFFGEKPLYYTHNGEEFIWASELKSLILGLGSKPAISKSALNLYFRLTYIPAPYSIYEGIHKLEPNRILEYDLKNFELKILPIHQDFNREKVEISLDEARKEARERVYNSVVSRSVSDVPIGTFLSGGVDSSVVSFCLAEHSSTKIDTFSIGFTKKSFDESDKSRTVANMINSNHHEFIISENDLKENVSDILLNFDEPFADSSALPTFLVSKKTSDFVKVALTGDGGDEIFGGYNKYYMGKLNARYTGLMPKFLHQSVKKLASPLLQTKDDNRGKRYKILRALESVDYSGQYYWDIISLGMTEPSLKELMKPEQQQKHLFEYYAGVSGISNPTSLNEYQLIDLHMSLEGDMLVKVDRTSMLNSLECRAPFLNRDLLQFTLSLPENYLLKGWNKKYLLKEAFKDVFPEGFLDKSKRGFGVPVGDWLREGLCSELESYIEPDFLKDQNLFNEEHVIKLVRNHLEGKVDNTFKVWTFFCFQKWYKAIYLS
ncbi:MAG: asparagine synthase (glutamine-hydrolyzing) [Flavobacteriaceae bacterium]|nr:asparagine synthase (glutamine-hydrolyzing) [Flavobacteriaceae bacterium]